MHSDNPSPPHEHACKSCGHKFIGNYCNVCGEKVIVAKERTFRTFIRDVRAAVALRDNKFLKTLWLIISKPGLVSKEYVEGRRVRYMRPLQLFFVLNLVYFLFPVLQLFNTSLHTQMYLRTHSALVRHMIHDAVGSNPVSLQGYTLMYNEKSTNLAKLLVIVFVFLASLPMNITYRKRNRYFSDHIVLAIELTAFNLAINAIFLSGLLMLVSKVIHMTHVGWEKYLDDSTLTIIFILTNLYFLFLAGRTFYHQTGTRLIIKVVLGMLGLFLALELYRLILFLVTFWML